MSWLDRLVSGWSFDDERRRAPRGDPQRVREALLVLDELRPMFLADGGDVDLLGVDEGWVEIHLSGSCQGCQASDVTVHGALEPRLKERYPWVVGVRVK